MSDFTKEIGEWVLPADLQAKMAYWRVDQGHGGSVLKVSIIGHDGKTLASGSSPTICLQQLGWLPRATRRT